MIFSRKSDGARLQLPTVGLVPTPNYHPVLVAYGEQLLQSCDARVVGGASALLLLDSPAVACNLLERVAASREDGQVGFKVWGISPWFKRARFSFRSFA